ncbi:MAG: hypothetical protein CL917_15220 [Deltaproteobacteria bacterium]|nr:hypothetical protein [Deltaproteobacteria bacterium]
MTVVRPFEALRYDLKQVDLSNVIVPPYDVVADDERDAFFERDPHNAIRFELTRDAADEATTDYAHLAELLTKWRQSGVLIKDDGPGYYVMKQSFESPEGTALERIGFYAELGLAEYEERQVMPHERTLAGPKADRLKLLKAAQANLSSVFLLYEDGKEALTAYLASAFGPEGEILGSATDDAGVHYELARLSDPEALSAIESFMSDQSCVIADGHHRYETALEYKRQRRMEAKFGENEEPFDSTLAYFANAYAPGSLLLPIHRVVSHRAVPSTEEWESALPGWARQEVKAEGDAGEVAAKAMALLDEHKGKAAFVADQANGSLQVFVRNEPLGEALLVRLIEGEVLGRVFGLDTDDIRAGEVRFPKSAERAALDVRQGKGTVALYLNPLQPEDVFRVTREGEVMPQKSTFFYPKIPTGMVFRVYEDNE